MRTVAIKRNEAALNRLNARYEALFLPGRQLRPDADTLLHPPADRLDRAKIRAMVCYFPRPYVTCDR
jgi:hypothetical protein